jgi:diguanylate cyclase (GGDEF)-like protein/PAS domain S-box-containing protein
MSSPWIASCEREQIHMPGAIQSWGAMLIAGEADLIVRFASANLADFIEFSAAEALGRPLSAVLDAATLAALLGAGTGEPAPGAVTTFDRAIPGHPPCAVACHRLNGVLTIEIERPAEGEGPAAAGTWSDARVVVEALRAATTLDSLLNVATTEMRRATGFDRSMAYRFDPAGHGEIVAEDCAVSLVPFLGLHYPASDVPRQARRLYLRQRVRVIEDSEAAAVPLLRAPGIGAAADLSLAALRTTSPIHLEYMRNMGVRASISISLTVDGVLWGMLVCHDRGPRHLAPPTRALGDLIGQVTSLMIGTLRDAQAREEAACSRARVTEFAAGLVNLRGGAAALATALGKDARALTGLCDATGAIIRLGGRTLSVGDAPHGAAASHLLDALITAAPEGGEPFATTETGMLLSEEQVAALQGRAAGALLLPLIHAPGDGIVWVRAEQAMLVRWGGNPALAVSIDGASGIASPRRSFAVWQQQVRGQSLPWTTAQIEAAQGLRREIAQALVGCAEAELARLRQHDALTGLPNRRLLREHLEAWAHDRPSSCLLAIEIDRFKAVNEAVGEVLGDGVLIEAAQRIGRAASGPGIMIARIGSIGFGVFCHAMESAAALAQAEAIRAALAEPFEISGKLVRLTASVGIAGSSSHTPGGSADDLMARADIALQTAKSRGGNRALVYSSRLRAGAGRLMDLEQELHAVLDGDTARAGAFRLEYQPCVALGAHQPGSPGTSRMPPLRGFEALLRWTHPRLGAIGPDEFIAVAEECGLIDAVGDWVLRRAVAQIAAWRDLAAGLPYEVWRVAINVSPHQLARPAFADEVIALLAAHDVPPQCLTIEVTEGVFADEHAAAMIAALREEGLKIAVDDFGIGYSSLSYLRRVPADELKLDRSFLARTDGGPLHEDLLSALVQLARAVGLQVLAEGVETEEHLAAVSAAGCDAAQGWLFARALPEAEAGQWIAAARAVTMPPHTRPRLPFSFRDIVEGATEAVLVTDARQEDPGRLIVYANPAFTRMSGWKLSELIGKSPAMLNGPKTDIAATVAMLDNLKDGNPSLTRIMSYARSGMPFWAEIRAAPLRDQHGTITHYVSIERDVTHELRRLEDLETLVERDALTSIANRRGLERFATSLPPTPDLPLCVAYIDIDRFKQINDTYGHAAGDAVLLGVADVLCENMRRMDFVGRLGGDEFLVCMPGILPVDARMVAGRLHRAIANHAFDTPAGPLRTDCSIGVAAMQAGDESLAEVIARADAALYAAKAAGRGRVVVEGTVMLQKEGEELLS